MLLIGKPAPHFSANAVVNATIVPDFSLDQFKGKKYVILFFYPKDFTFVCPTELIGFQEALGEFDKRDVAVVGCSTDSEFSHWAWVNTPRSQGGIQGVPHPTSTRPFPPTTACWPEMRKLTKTAMWKSMGS